jgi:hypothetical protein
MRLERLRVTDERPIRERLADWLAALPLVPFRAVLRDGRKLAIESADGVVFARDRPVAIIYGEPVAFREIERLELGDSDG